VQSFTDKTGAPGKLGCIPMTGSIDFTTPTNMPKGLATSFEVLQQNLSIPNASAITYTWSAANFNPSSGTGILYAPAVPATTGTYEVVLTARSEGYCDLETSRTVTVIECNPSLTYTLAASASGFCEGETGVTFALSGTQAGRSYELYRDGAPTAVATLTGTGSPATFSTVMTEGSYTAQVLASANGYCEAAMSGTPVIFRNSLPAAPEIAQPADVCLNSGDIVFTATGYSGSLTWVSVGGGAESGNSVTFNSATTGTKTETARSSQTHTNAPTCYSGEVTQSASVQALPATPVLAASASTVCIGTDITFRVTEPVSGATYTWSGTEGMASGTGDGTYTVSDASTGTISVTAYASLTSNGITCQSANSSLKAYVSQPGGDGQAYDPTCGCAPSLNYCSNTNTCRTPTTTYTNGACTGVCNRRYRYYYNECGVQTSSGTYTDANCTAGCEAALLSSCHSNESNESYSSGYANNTACNARCKSIATGYRYYYYKYNPGDADTLCLCYKCN
jgi:hypothetical protein